MKKLTTEEWIKKAKATHGDKYDYSKSEYIGSHDKICIICPEHGEFWQEAKSHFKGQGCPCCNVGGKIGKEKFIKRAKEIHGDKYDYSKVEYKTAHDKVCIICPKHGEFFQKPYKHTNMKRGCPSCGQEIVAKNPNKFIVSKGELFIKNWLQNNNISFKYQYSIISKKIARNSGLIICDFLVKYNNKYYIIEYNGQQHYKYIKFFYKEYKDFENQQRRDKLLTEICDLNGIELVVISYKENKKKIEERLNTLFNI
jgi:hypothetical protein